MDYEKLDKINSHKKRLDAHIKTLCEVENLITGSRILRISREEPAGPIAIETSMSVYMIKPVNEDRFDDELFDEIRQAFINYKDKLRKRTDELQSEFDKM